MRAEQGGGARAARGGGRAEERGSGRRCAASQRCVPSPQPGRERVSRWNTNLRSPRDIPGSPDLIAPSVGPRNWMNPFRIPADLGPRFRSPEQVPRRRGVLAARRDACGSSRGGGGPAVSRPHASHADGVRLNGCIARLSGGGADPPYRLRRCPRGLAANRANRADAACFRRALAANRASGAGAGWFRSTPTGIADAPDRPT